MSEQKKSVRLGDIVREFDLEILQAGQDYENGRWISTGLACP